MLNFLNIYTTSPTLPRKNTCYKSSEKPSCVDQILKNCQHTRIWNKTLWLLQTDHDCYETSLPETKTENHMLPTLYKISYRDI